MIELNPQDLDPLNFLLWEKIIDTAKRRRKSNCNWKPFVVNFLSVADNMEVKSKKYIGQEIKIMTVYYTTSTPMSEMVEDFGGTSTSIAKLAEQCLIKLIRLARESLASLPCQVYSIKSRQLDNKRSVNLKIPLFKVSEVFANSPEEAIKLCQKYKTESLQYDLEVQLVRDLKDKSGESDEITFI